MEDKKKLLFLSLEARFPLPTSRFDQNYYLFNSLLHCHEWNKDDTYNVRAIFVDLDAIARTKPLDEWALKAWRNTFNDMVVKCISREGEAPVVLAYTQDANWEMATLAVRVGARDITKLSKIEEKIEFYLGISSDEVLAQNPAQVPDQYLQQAIFAIGEDELRVADLHHLPAAVEDKASDLRNTGCNAL